MTILPIMAMTAVHHPSAFLSLCYSFFQPPLQLLFVRRMPAHARPILSAIFPAFHRSYFQDVEVWQSGGASVRTMLNRTLSDLRQRAGTPRLENALESEPFEKPRKHENAKEKRGLFENYMYCIGYTCMCVRGISSFAIFEKLCKPDRRYNTSPLRFESVYMWYTNWLYIYTLWNREKGF